MKQFAIDMIKRMKKHDINSYAAQCAYYLLLAFFPFIIIIIMAITTMGVNSQKIIEVILNLFPSGTSNLIKDYLIYSTDISTSVFSPLLITTLLISSNAVGALIKAFNKAFDLKEKRGYFKKKFISILFIIITVSVFTLLLMISALGIKILNHFSDYLNLPRISTSFFEALLFIINFLIYFSFIGCIYYILPAKKLSIKKILPGTLFATPTLAVMTNLFGFVVHNFTKYSLVYGSLTSIVMLLIWMYISSAILIVGARSLN